MFTALISEDTASWLCQALLGWQSSALSTPPLPLTPQRVTAQGHYAFLSQGWAVEMRRITTEMSHPPDHVAIKIFETALGAASV